MKPITAGTIMALEVMIGRWSKDKPLSIKDGIAGTVFLLMLMSLSSANAELGHRVALLAVLTVSIIYIPDIVKGFGFTK